MNPEHLDRPVGEGDHAKRKCGVQQIAGELGIVDDGRWISDEANGEELLAKLVMRMIAG